MEMPAPINENAPGQEEALLAACRAVGDRLGIAIPSPPWNGTERDLVSAVARAARVQIRRVQLTEDWWRQDNGPLLAFREIDNHPVALLPTSVSSYEMVDPATVARLPVNLEEASKLERLGYSFYRTMPPQALTIGNIIQFGLPGTRKDWLTTLFLGLAEGLLGMLFPVATGMVFGYIIPGGERHQLLLLVLALGVNAVVLSLLQFTQEIAVLRLETRMDSSVETGLWDRLLSLPVGFFRRYSAGELAVRAMGIGRIRQILTETTLESLLTFAFSSVSFGFLFYLDVKLALLALVLFVGVVGATWLSAWMQLRYEKEGYRVHARAMGLVYQFITGISRLRVAGAEQRAMACWAKHYGVQTNLTYRGQSLANKLSAFMAAVPTLTALATFATVAFFPRENFTLAMFLAFNAALVQIFAATVMMSSAVSSILEVVPLYEGARPILETLPEFDRGRGHPGELSGAIILKKVSFRFHPDGPLILNDVSLEIRPGEFIALVGPSGAGKSTILRLLLGFEAPTTGAIQFDQRDLAHLDLQSVRRQMGVVLQNSQLIPGDLFTNITGSAAFKMKDAQEAARLSGLDEDIKQMPMGMYTMITEGESTLSGGQRQRLLIARALVGRPKILLFDEAMSAMDNVIQARITRNLEQLHATRIVVAHRLSTIINADRIVVVEGGKIVQQGKYEDLIREPGLFAALVKRQLT